MRFLAFPIALSLFFVSASASAWEFPRNDRASKETYRRLKKDFDSNPIWKNASLNLYRDGKRSGYLSSNDPFREQANPLTAAQIAALPEASFISWKIFNRAIRGMRKILETLPSLRIRQNLLTLVDFDQKTESRRFFVLDLEEERVVFQTWVHHGKMSDQDRDRLPEQFGNVKDSNKSSLGFYMTERHTYEGRWGHSVRMHGLDRSLNSKIYQRAIVMHPWLSIHPRRLVTKDPAQTSMGCLSLAYYESGKFLGMKDEPLAHLIIDHIVGRSLIYVHSSVTDLEKASDWLNGKMSPEIARATLAQIAADESRVLEVEEAQEYPAGSNHY